MNGITTAEYPIDENGCRTFYEIETRKATKILATDEAAILAFQEATMKSLQTTHIEAFYIRIDDPATILSRLLFWRPRKKQRVLCIPPTLSRSEIQDFCNDSI